MSLTTTATEQSFAATQGTLSFTFQAIVAQPEDIKVFNKLVTTGEETALTYTTDYTVVVDADGVGGDVTLVATYGTTVTHVVRRKTTKTQANNYEDYSQFPSDTLELDLDRQMMVLQEQAADEANTSNKYKAWVTFDGTASDPIVPVSVFGVSSSVTKNSTGDYTVTFLPTFANTSYGAILSGGGTTDFALVKIKDGVTTSTTAITISTLDTSFAALDVKYITVGIVSN